MRIIILIKKGLEIKIIKRGMDWLAARCRIRIRRRMVEVEVEVEMGIKVRRILIRIKRIV